MVIVDFNKSPAIYWGNKTKADYLERQILVHSNLYYNRNTTVISDKEFDYICRMLVKMFNIDKTLVNQTEYGYAFRGFDGSTGFDLWYKLTDVDKRWIDKITNIVYNNYMVEHRRYKGVNKIG